MLRSYIQELRYFSLIDQHWSVLIFKNLLYTFVPFHSTGARGRIGVRGQRRPSDLPLTLTAVWRLSLTRTASLYQHTASPWVCLSFHQSLAVSLRSQCQCLWAIAESSLVQLQPHARQVGAWQRRSVLLEVRKRRERDSLFMCNVGWETDVKEKRWELFLWRQASLSASLMHLPRGRLHFLKASFNCFCTAAKSSGEWSTGGDKDHFNAIVRHIGKYTYLLP